MHPVCRLDDVQEQAGGTFGVAEPEKRVAVNTQRHVSPRVAGGVGSFECLLRQIPRPCVLPSSESCVGQVVRDNGHRLPFAQTESKLPALLEPGLGRVEIPGFPCVEPEIVECDGDGSLVADAAGDRETLFVITAARVEVAEGRSTDRRRVQHLEP